MKSLLRLTQITATLAACSVGTSPSFGYEFDTSEFESHVIQLGPGKLEVQKTIKSQVVLPPAYDFGPWYPYRLCRLNLLKLDTSAVPNRPYEVEIVLKDVDFEETLWNLEFIDPTLRDTREVLERRTVMEGSDATARLVYRELCFDQQPFFLVVNQHPTSKPLPEGADSQALANVDQSPTLNVPFTLEVTLREVNYCSMWAKVSGDVNLTTYGDVAYFNRFEQGAGYATGSMADPELAGMVSDWMEGFGEMMEAAGNEEASKEMARQKKDWEKSEFGLQTGGEERFGLTLIDQSNDADRLAGGLRTLVSGFSLEAAAPGTLTLNEAGYTVDLSRLEVTPGARDLSGGNRIVFGWTQGEPGSATMYLRAIGDYMVVGTIEGDLYTQEHYDGGRKHIKVLAKFAALQGALACNR